MYELISYIEPYMSVNHRFIIYFMHRAFFMSIAHYELSSFFGSMYDISSCMKTFFGSMYEISSYMKTFFGSMYKISSCYDRGFVIDEIMILSCMSYFMTLRYNKAKIIFKKRKSISKRQKITTNNQKLCNKRFSLRNH